MKRIAIITTHPIQYYAPLFRLIQERGKIQLKVFYTWGEQVLKNKYDPGFGREVEWDIPLLSGYEYEFLKNTSPDPGSHHFKGIINPDIIKCIETYDPDAILVIGWNFKSHWKVMKHFKGKLPVCFRGDSTLLDEAKGFSIRKLARRIALKYIYRHVDIAFYTGEANRQYFLKHGIKEKQLRYAPHAVDNSRFASVDNETVSSKKKELFIGETEKVFLFAGKLESKKDPALLLHAFIEANIKNCHLIIAGDGKLKDELMDIAATNNQKMLSVNKKIHFLPFQNQTAMPVLYRMADIFVLPSIGPGETWGLSVNEAMASGLAVIVSDKCGCGADLVSDESTGYIFKAGDKNDLIKKLELSIASGEKLEAQKTTSIKKIKKFTLSHIAEAIENS